MLETLAGHAWTLLPNVWQRLRPPLAPLGQPWSASLLDARQGSVRLTGIYHAAASAPLLVVVHGLGGSHLRPYCVRAARTATAQGWGVLRIALRGADRLGEDIHHAGLYSDFEAILASPALQQHRDVFLLGYSLGGHLALRYASDKPDARVRGVAVVCTPVDLAANGAYVDRAFCAYRRHLLQGLKSTVRACVLRNRAHTAWEPVRRAQTLREFDQCVIVPRFHYRDVDDYYASESAKQFLPRLRVPTLFCASTRDPMVPAPLLCSALANAPAALDLRWIAAGGHVQFPRDLDLGERGPRGLESQILGWMDARH